MIHVLIIEDEAPAAVKLIKQVNELQPDWIIMATHDSISSSVEFLQINEPDLIFMDIHLADGDSFEIFNQIKIKCPVIFTTAHSDFAIKAFKVNGLDYLLKPIPNSEIKRVIKKFKNQTGQKLPENIHTILQNIQTKHKERFLIKMNKQLISIPVKAIAYFYSEDKLSFIKTEKGDRFPLDESLDKIEKQLDSNSFFRINRKTILNINAIQKIESYFNGRLSLTIMPTPEEKVIVSREKVRYFKKWLGD